MKNILKSAALIVVVIIAWGYIVNMLPSSVQSALNPQSAKS